MPANMREDTVIFEIREHLGVIAKKKNGWSRELNLVCWNNQEPPKFDVRDWSRDHKHMSRGITMYSDEMRRLFTLYMDWNNQIVVEKAQDEKRRNSEEYYQQRDAIRERFSSAQKVVPDVEEEEWEPKAETSVQPAASQAVPVEAETEATADTQEASAEGEPDMQAEAAAGTQEESSEDLHPEAFATPAAEAAAEDMPF